MKSIIYGIAIASLFISISTNRINSNSFAISNKYSNSILHKYYRTKDSGKLTPQLNSNDSNQLVTSLPKFNPNDNSSFSDPDGITQTQLDLNITIDMEKTIIFGYVRFHYKCNKATDTIILDIRDLVISKIESSGSDPKQLNYQVYKNTINSVGDALIIQLPAKCSPNIENDDKTTSNNLNKLNYIDIYYFTTPGTIGLHFSDPSVLHDKNYSFLYTHGEAIYSRTYVPSQDTPSLKVKLLAKIRIKKPYNVLFSGDLISTETDDTDTDTYNIYNYDMQIPIPTYLISITAGALKKQTIPNTRCEVYGEPKALNYINETFSYCEKYLKFYETYLPFQFKKMIFTITPKDYPFSGMENPYNVYISESVLSSDMSYTSTVAHEIVHFWSGNLVTAANWESFWLNEGITTYLNRKAFREVHDEETFKYELYRGLDSLKLALKLLKENPELDSSMRSLTPKLTDDPYKTFCRVPYEKGAFFMYYLETLLSDKVFTSIMSKYFDTYKYKTVNTDEFVRFLKEKVVELHPEGKEKLEEVKWDDWLKGTEMIPFDFNVTSERVDRMKKLTEMFLGSDVKDDDKNGEFEKNDESTNIDSNSNKTKEIPSVEELTNTFDGLKIIEKNKILSEINNSYNKLDSDYKKRIKKFIKKEDKKKTFDAHMTLTANREHFRALTIEDTTKRIEFISKTLNEFKYYKATYVRAFFKMLKEVNSDKDFLMGELNKIKKMLNPITFYRIKEFIEIKPVADTKGKENTHKEVKINLHNSDDKKTKKRKLKKK